jgi:carbon storage regulator CsrA
MLVLSRRETEKVLFPTLGISVEILRVRGNTTKLGIDAPADIPIIRHEIARPKSIEFALDEGSSSEQLSGLAHAVRRRLSNAANALNQLHKEMDTNGDEAVQEIVMRLYADLEGLEREANSAIEWSSKAKSLQILLVEDSVVERKLLAGALELSGLNVHTANDGQDALNYLSMHAMPDAVLLDMLMPRCDGPCFVHEVRSNPQLKGLKIFAVSTIEPSTLGLVTGENGIDGWFPKPLEPAELVSVLDERLNKPVPVA